MRVRNWLASAMKSIIRSIGVVIYRRGRRYKKRLVLRVSAAAIALTTMIAIPAGHASAQCIDPLFADPVSYAAGISPNFIATDDFNGDGITDLAATNSQSDDVSILLGNGDGTFQGQQTYFVGNDPGSITTGDFDGDGVIDLATTTFNPLKYGDVSCVSVLLGNGDGTFAEKQTFELSPSERSSITTGDFNGDGDTDLAATNYSSDEVSVFLGNGDGTFQAEQTFPAGNRQVSIATGDFNGDGITDLATGNPGDDPPNVSVLLGNGDGTFAEHQGYLAGSFTLSITTGDFNDDGLFDLATANFLSDDVSVLLGNGDGTFQAQQSFAVDNAPSSVTTGDFNGDGNMDLVTAWVTVLLGNGDGTFQTKQSYGGGGNQFVTTDDFNEDGVADLATVFLNTVRVQLGQCIILGDVNQDGVVNLLDVERFIEVLMVGYQVEADINQDGDVNLADVEPFIELLTDG